MSALTSEWKLEQECVTMAERNGWLALKLNVSGWRGWPDRLFIKPSGRAQFVEFKTPKGRLSPLQVQVHEQLAKRGTRVIVVSSVEEFAKVLYGRL